MQNFNMSFPISFVKKEERIVIGIATADNIDKSGDIVDFNASIDAFQNWAGNIREMHSPIAVGKAIKYDKIQVTGDNGVVYNAIRVEAYISKGAQNTWEKILDGTLQAFSIGGRVVEKQIDESKIFNGKPVYIIKKYILGELSLVDNPANALAVVDIIKMDLEGNLDYVLDENIYKDTVANYNFEKKLQYKDPKGGLTAAGRAHYNSQNGGNLKPGVRGAADTPEKMRRKGSFLTRFFTNPSGPMKDEKGRPTRLALSAAAWGEPVPQNAQDAADLAAKGRRLLERYAASKNKSIEDMVDDDNEILNQEIEYFLSDEYLYDEYNFLLEDEDISKNQVYLLQDDVKYDNIINMDEPDDNKLSFIKRMINWLVPDIIEDSLVELSIEDNSNTQEDNMDIEMLKEALGAVVDEKLAVFATSIKEEVESSVQEKIDNLSKSLDASAASVKEKLDATDKAIAEQTVKVDSIASTGAIKKSADPEEEDDGELELSKSSSDSVWNNIYLPQALISALGYKS